METLSIRAEGRRIRGLRVQAQPDEPLGEQCVGELLAQLALRVERELSLQEGDLDQLLRQDRGMARVRVGPLEAGKETAKLLVRQALPPAQKVVLQDQILELDVS